MAAVDDENGLQKRIYDLAKAGKLVELRALLEEHPEVNVDGYRDGDGRTALYWACSYEDTECARLLIDHKADVNAKDFNGWSALHTAAVLGHLSCAKLLVQNGADMNCQSDEGLTTLMSFARYNRMTVSQYLLEQKADVHYRISNEGYSKNWDALYRAMWKCNRTSGVAFSFLSCNTDAKNVKIDSEVTTAIRDAHIEDYKHVQGFIDEYHHILNLVLSEHVPVDPRFGLGQMGIYQEPLERTLEYLGLSMSKDQVVNTSIDGEAVKRALIPGHLLNANHWFNKYTESR
jgi:ankyrin repeat protein